MAIELNVNGRSYTVDTDPETSLLTVLRDHLGLTGSKYGCGEGECGACTVLIGNYSRRSCITKVGHVRGKPITTVEGLAAGAALHPLQAAFREHHALQCGYCTPGMVMALVSLLAEEPGATEEQIRRGLEGNLCRCTGYTPIVAAARSVAEGRSGGVS